MNARGRPVSGLFHPFLSCLVWLVHGHFHISPEMQRAQVLLKDEESLQSKYQLVTCRMFLTLLVTQNGKPRRKSSHIPATWGRSSNGLALQSFSGSKPWPLGWNHPYIRACWPSGASYILHSLRVGLELSFCLVQLCFRPPPASGSSATGT